MPLNPALGRKRQVVICEFKSCLVYKAGLRTATAVTQRNPVSGNGKKTAVSCILLISLISYRYTEVCLRLNEIQLLKLQKHTVQIPKLCYFISSLTWLPWFLCLSIYTKESTHQFLYEACWSMTSVYKLTLLQMFLLLLHSHTCMNIHEVG